MTSNDEVATDDDAVAAIEVEATETVVLEQLAPWGDGALAAAIGRLTVSQQVIVECRYVNDEELSTIARATGTTVSAVSQRLATIHRQLELALAA